jgi:Zn-dependent peptidase ImmA (M78 family)
MNVFKARNKAKKVLRELNLDADRTDLDTIAHSVNISVKYEKLENDISGVFVPKEGGGEIYINKSDVSYRQRFTYAHELGHFFLNHCQGVHIDKIYRDPESTTALNPKEVEANNFAAELLMPAKRVESALSKIMNLNPQNEDEIHRKLADQFDVSKQAISNRLKNLGYTFSVE